MQQLTTDAADIKRAKLPHEILTINVVVLHIFLSVALLKFANEHLAIPIPIAISLVIIVWTYFKARAISKEGNCFVHINWQITLYRYKFLVASYIIYAVIIGIGALVTQDAPATMDGTNIVYSIFNILSVVPLFITLLALTVLGSGSLFNVSRGEVPEKLVEMHC